MSFDLHTHSTCSDGTYTIDELIHLAKEKNLQGLSITDHDTVQAYPEAIVLGKKQGIQVIPGVEFSAHLDEKSVHILGYSFNFTNSALLELCARHKTRRLERNRKMIKKLQNKGFAITEEELISCARGVVGRPHLAKILLDKGYVASIPDAFNQYLGDGKSCYEAGTYFTVQETLDAIHTAGGLAILAHPHLHKSKEFVKKILKHPFDGIEAEYASISPDKNAFWLDYGKKHKLLMTGGSDFHGSIKPNLPLGATTVNREQVKSLLDHFYSHYPEYHL